MKSKQYHLEQLAQLVNGQFVGQADLNIQGLASLEHAQAHHISFVNGEKYLQAASVSQAGALIVTAELLPQLDHCQNFIIVANPYLAFAMLTHAFEKKTEQVGIEATARISNSAIISDTAYIGHYAVIGDHCVIADHCVIQHHVHIDDDVEIGAGSLIESHVVISAAAKLGARVRIHSNTVIGGEGFGFAPYQGQWKRIAQLGSVQIGDDVRIGSNCSVDRGALDDTIIENGVIIDNLVQVAHNVHIGANTAIAAKCGIAGSTQIGKNCTFAGAVGVVGHIQIADHVTITGMSMVTKSITEAGVYASGIGAIPAMQWKKAVIRVRQLADVPLTKILKQLDHMQTQIESLESTLKMRK
ncbi:UDP-3-O-[3-hydroxymyristoyl] glucosamine N-acyltransferase [Acinetobacter calcoaceticus]|uniref:UDP-3-O-acylglucosamine N-acyltransferase n=1 Tax=Acinetobacter calcoaceticus TaxID=471 RepID=A0A4V2R1F5_ACICA|nr:UDP-3-O-[3-hydroxymyristoyl] glucosamine N-acyltransferase [Acinetobacter calcoaceticus]